VRRRQTGGADGRRGRAGPGAISRLQLEELEHRRVEGRARRRELALRDAEGGARAVALALGRRQRLGRRHLRLGHAEARRLERRLGAAERRRRRLELGARREELLGAALALVGRRLELHAERLALGHRALLQRALARRRLELLGELDLRLVERRA